MPAFSPDGRWLAYVSNATGTPEVYVRGSSPGGAASKVSVGGGNTPRWTPDGRALVYRTFDGQVVIVTLGGPGSQTSVRRVERWPTPALADTGVVPNFDLSADGSRIIALLPASDENRPTMNRVVFVINFADDVRKRVAGN